MQAETTHNHLKIQYVSEVVMCQSNAFLIKKNGTEEMVMEDVSLITPRKTAPWN
jgi:hypothetical protein